MIETITMRKQLPNVEGNWLYKDTEFIRLFSKCVYLPDGAEPWAECTDEAKQQWEAEHPQPEPEPEPKQEQSHE